VQEFSPDMSRAKVGGAGENILRGHTGEYIFEFLYLKLGHFGVCFIFLSEGRAPKRRGARGNLL